MSRGVAVVTGGSAGLGRAIVRELAARDWDVAILARGQEGLDGAVADVEALGRRGLGVSTDVADREAVDAAADRVEAELGPIDLWVNDAMVGVFGEFVSTDPEDFERAFAVNFFGFVNGTRAALKRMTPRNAGHIIQIGSALAHRGIPLQASYCAAKHGIQGFTESVTAELTHNKSNISISTVDMPAMNTMQFSWVKSQLPDHPQPVPPISQPEVCARVVADVAEKPRKRTWVGEATVGTVLGNRFAAGFMDRYLANSAYSGQQAPEKKNPMLPTNLYEPTPGDHGAHGIFDDKAHGETVQTWAIRHRPLVYSVAAGIAGLAAVAVGKALKR